MDAWGDESQQQFPPQGWSWAVCEQCREASHSFPYKVQFDLRVQQSKKWMIARWRDKLLKRKKCNNRAWVHSGRCWLQGGSFIVPLLLNIGSWWTCVKVPHPQDEMGKLSAIPSSNHLWFIIAKFTASLELGEPVYLQRWQLWGWGCYFRNSLGDTKWHAKEGQSLMVEKTKNLSHKWPQWEGTICTLGIGCISVGV